MGWDGTGQALSIVRLYSTLIASQAYENFQKKYDTTEPTKGYLLVSLPNLASAKLNRVVPSNNFPESESRVTTPKHHSLDLISRHLLVPILTLF